MSDLIVTPGKFGPRVHKANCKRIPAGERHLFGTVTADHADDVKPAGCCKPKLPIGTVTPDPAADTVVEALIAGTADFTDVALTILSGSSLEAVAETVKVPKTKTPKVKATKPEPVPAPKVKASQLVVSASTVKAAEVLAKIPGTTVTDGWLIIDRVDAQAIVNEISTAMREGVKADRGGFMYTEGKLRGVRAAIIAGTDAVLPPRPTKATKSTKAEAAERLAATARAKEQHAAEKAWKAAGADPATRPATPDLDALRTNYEAKTAA